MNLRKNDKIPKTIADALSLERLVKTNFNFPAQKIPLKFEMSFVISRKIR